MSPAQARPRRRVLTAFRIGVLSGLATCALIAGLLEAWARWVEWLPPYTVEIVADGADVSRLGGKRIVVENSSAGVLFAATCNGACDNLGYRLQTAEDEDVKYRVQVLGAAGACVACGSYWYVQPVYGSPGLSRWTIAGRDRLAVEPKRFDFHKDGALTPVRTPEPPDPDGTVGEAAPKN